MTQPTDARRHPGPAMAHDIEALGLVVGMLSVIALLCLLTAVWPGAI